MSDVMNVDSTDDREQPRDLNPERAERRAIVEAMREPFRDVSPEEIEREADRLLELERSERRRVKEKSVATR